MSVKKFKFVSPGIFLNEIDNSQLPKAPEEMGPVVIGRADRGPGMVPTKVDSYAEFVETFGSPVPGGKGGDVWREGNKLGPTYGAYAAQAWLRNSGPLTFVRLLGNEHPDRTDTGTRAGWNVDGTFSTASSAHGCAYGLFVADHTAATQATADITVASTYVSGTDHNSANGLIGGDITVAADGTTTTLIYRESSGYNYAICISDNTTGPAGRYSDGNIDLSCSAGVETVAFAGSVADTWATDEIVDAINSQSSNFIAFSGSADGWALVEGNSVGGQLGTHFAGDSTDGAAATVVILRKGSTVPGGVDPAVPSISASATSPGDLAVNSAVRATLVSTETQLAAGAVDFTIAADTT